ncbi:MAG: hypothetical protein ACFFG0_37140, partial [Candidatus Thorarchaeota archaeon]
KFLDGKGVFKLKFRFSFLNGIDTGWGWFWWTWELDGGGVKRERLKMSKLFPGDAEQRFLLMITGWKKHKRIVGKCLNKYNEIVLRSI